MFQDLEIWWVTGAQLLYGGDAVVAVDGHSKEMVEGLNACGNIPVKIVYKGITLLFDPYFVPKGGSGCFQIAPKP